MANAPVDLERTSDTGPTAFAAEAEASALGAISELADKLFDRTAAVGGSEWTRAGEAIERWISAASSSRAP
ncbi:MAG: hypothetical protein ABWX70_10505 [Hyphomicrobium sp.]